MRHKIILIILFPFFFIGTKGCNEKNDIDVLNSEHMYSNMVSVIDHGIKNDGTIIGSEINNLVRKSYGKTLFFPAGIYNLSEPIVLPLDYTKNVNVVFDKNALVKSDKQLEALIKVGYSEIYIKDPTHRRFSYIEGGILDCYNADNGILVNGLKQLVSIRTMSLVRGRNTHIRINVTDDFLGTASSDTKIDNVTIQGMSSNEDIYGIYIDGSCHDNKISDTFIYGTKYAVVTKSAGHFLNNVHILSLSSTGGTDLGYEDNFRDTEGIRIETGGFFIFNQVYYDTVDKAIVVTDNHAPILLLDQNVSFSYLDNFGSSFIYRDKSATSDMQVKLSNSVFTLKNRKGSYKIFDMNVPMIGWDVRETFTFINCAIENPHLINPYDPCLLQRLRKTTSDAIIFTDISNFDTEWHVLGALVTSPYRNLLRLDFDDNFVLELDAKFTGTFDLIDYKILNSNNPAFQIGYVIKDDFCVLLFRPKASQNFYPIISDLLGNGSFMPTPSKDQHYRLVDYDITNEPIVIINMD